MDCTDYSVYEMVGGAEGIDAYNEAEAMADDAAGEAEDRAWAALYESGEDDGFEKWEMERGCHLDPQSGYGFPI